MKFFIITIILFTCFTFIHADDMLCPLDSLKKINSIDRNLANRLSLFTEYKEFIQARLFQASPDSFLLEIEYKQQNQLYRKTKVLKQSEYEQLLGDFRSKYQLSLNSEDLLDQDGRIILIVGYGVNSLAYYSWSIPLALNLDGSTFAGAYTLLTGGTILAAMSLTKKKEVTIAEANLSLAFSQRGILHGFLLEFIITDEPSNDMLLLNSLVSVGEGLYAYKYAVNQKLTEGEAASIRIHHDFLLTETGALLWMTNNSEIFNKKSALTLLIGSCAGGAYLGKQISEKINFTAGDAIVLQNAWSLGASIALSTGVVGEASEKGYVSLYAAGAIAGLLGGEYMADRYDLSRADGSYLTLSTWSGGLIGYGTSLLIQGDRPDAGQYKTRATLAALGSLTGFGLYTYRIESKKISSKKPVTFFEVIPALIVDNSENKKKMPLAGIEIHF